MQRSLAKGLTARIDAQISADDAEIQGNIVRKILEMMIHKHRGHT